MIPDDLRRRVDAAREIDPGEPAWHDPYPHEPRWGDPARWRDWPDSPLPFERAGNQPDPECPSRVMLWIALAWSFAIMALAVALCRAGS